MLKAGELYPLGDHLPLAIQRQLNGGKAEGFPSDTLGLSYRNVRARWDGKPCRAPKKGEWYLSGAIITAYRAPNDLTLKFHIAELVEVEPIPASFRVKRVLV